MVKLTLFVIGIGFFTLTWAVAASIAACRREAKFRALPSTKRLEELADETRSAK
jgi:HAMP domain-containing protein